MRRATYLHPNRILNIIAAVVLAVKACEEMVMWAANREGGRMGTFNVPSGTWAPALEMIKLAK